VWTAIKTDYRLFVAGGQYQQTVTMGKTEGIAKLIEMASKLNGEDMSNAAASLVSRIAYVDFFAAVLKRVPRVLPYEEGALWWDAVRRPFTARLFFPEKTIIDDSERTRRYTGVWVARSGEGSSISIGYMGESYID